MPRSWLLLSIFGLFGCGGSTSLLLSLSLASPPQPAALRVTLYGDGLLVGPSSVPLASAGRTLPGRLVVESLDAATPDPRVLVDGVDDAGVVIAQAAARASLSAGAQTELDLTLGPPLVDSDGDGVPDVIDDCPTVPDPDQHCAQTGGMDLSATIDAAPSEGGSDGGALPCPPNALFCDDFESGSTSKWTSITNPHNDISIQVDSVMPWRGTYALDVRAPSDTVSNAGSAEESASQTVYATLAARGYVYQASTPVGGYTMYFALFGMASNAYSFGVDSKGNWVITQNAGNGYPDLPSNVPFQTNHWYCVEMIMEGPSPSYPNGRIRLQVDSQTVIDATPGPGMFAPVDFDFGLVRVPASTPTHAYFDDFALATSPIGCE